MIPLSPYKAHCQRWEGGCGAEICLTATRRVFARGKLPCDVLFVGEAPGKSEDLIGEPFVGPAGIKLNDMISRALADFPEHEFRIAFTNLVSCIPLAENSEKFEEPPDEAIQACKPRLEEFLQIANPRLILATGKHAEDWLAQGYKHSVKLHRPDVRIVPIMHPAAILRAPYAAKSLLTKRTIATISDALGLLV